MNTKLTLTINDAVIKKRAKSYAQKQGRSLSALIENYLMAITQKEEIVAKDDEYRL